MEEFELIAIFLIPAAFTLYLSLAPNRNEPGTNEHQSLRLCRIALSLSIWSFGFGLIGFALAFVAFILGIVAIVKGRTLYSIIVIILSICIPWLGLAYGISTITNQL